MPVSLDTAMDTSVLDTAQLTGQFPVTQHKTNSRLVAIAKRKPGSRPGCGGVRYLRAQRRQHPTPGGGCIFAPTAQDLQHTSGGIYTSCGNSLGTQKSTGSKSRCTLTSASGGSEVTSEVQLHALVQAGAGNAGQVVAKGFGAC